MENMQSRRTSYRMAMQVNILQIIIIYLNWGERDTMYEKT